MLPEISSQNRFLGLPGYSDAGTICIIYTCTSQHQLRSSTSNNQGKLKVKWLCRLALRVVHRTPPNILRIRDTALASSYTRQADAPLATWQWKLNIFPIPSWRSIPFNFRIKPGFLALTWLTWVNTDGYHLAHIWLVLQRTSLDTLHLVYKAIPLKSPQRLHVNICRDFLEHTQHACHTLAKTCI